MIHFKNLITVEQGSKDEFDFYITSIDASDLIVNSNVERLSEGRGVQRYLNEQRTLDIAKFCQQNDAIFPTPIIVSLNTDFVSQKNKNEGEMFVWSASDAKNKLDGDLVPFSIIDGQHRLAGIEKYFETNKENQKKFMLPLIIYKDASIESSAKIFVTINANQRSVDRSTISQLFGVIYKNSSLYTVESFASTVVNSLNSSNISPFYHQIKMLGRKTNKNEFISQGTVAKKIIDRISSNIQEDNLNIEKGQKLTKGDSSKIFREYFIKNTPERVTEFMINYFSAFEIAFTSVWYNEDLLTKKAVGFSSLMNFFTSLHLKRHFQTFNEVLNFFEKYSNETIENELQQVFSKSRGSSESVAKQISDHLNNIFQLNDKFDIDSY